jgi:hypothetical protein
VGPITGTAVPNGGQLVGPHLRLTNDLETALGREAALTRR